MIIVAKFKVGDEVHYLGEKSIFSSIVERVVQEMVGHEFDYTLEDGNYRHNEDELFGSYVDAAKEKMLDALSDAEGVIYDAYNGIDNSKIRHGKHIFVKRLMDGWTVDLLKEFEGRDE